MMNSYRFIRYAWDDKKAASCDPVGRLIYRSNLLGSDQRITNTGGGNTSAKISEKDPLNGSETEVLWVKGSGGDLRTSTRENFSSLYQQKLLDMQLLYASRPDRGYKGQAEDDMVGMYTHTTFNLNPRASSIDTPLHSFLPGKHVDHMHPNAIISIAASHRCQELTQEIFGGTMAYVPWMRPGFELGLTMQDISKKNPSLQAIEYWLLEEAKLKRMPNEKELARQVIIVIGAGSGIGKETAHRLVREGAHIVCVDLNAESANATAKEITDRHGIGIGVAGIGISGCGPAVGIACDITKRASIRSMLDQVSLAYGGFDSICVTAGIFVPSDTSGHIPDDKWALTFAINVTGSYLVADEAGKNWLEQGLHGSLVLTTSANAAVAKKGSVAYDTSKAAANHLVRELAIELAPLVRVNGVAPATVVQGSAMFPRDRVIGSLAKYRIDYTEEEPTESLVSKLAQFYADRTLTKSPITPADQAEAYFLLVSQRLSKTTGQLISVDGGLYDAFLR